jgi:hypothetical protein
MNGSQGVIRDRDPGTQAVLDRLLALRPGQLVRYGELTRLAGGDVQGERRWCLASAMKAARRDHRRVYECETDVGVRSLTDHDLARSRKRYTKRVHRMAERNRDKMCCADLGVLSMADREALCKQISLLAMVGSSTSVRAVKRLEAGPIDARPAMSEVGDVAGM